MTDLTYAVLIVDDEPNIRAGLARGLASEVDRVQTAANGEEAIALIGKSSFQLLIADVRLGGGMDGISLVRRIRQEYPDIACIVITAHGTVETAVEAMQAGAFDFIAKPLDLNLIREQVRKARQHYQLRAENQELRNRLADVGEISSMIGTCAAMQDVFQQVRQVASTDATVMIHGESGTGKELVARALHDLSGRRAGPFHAINVGAMPETLLESELFGHEKGAFSGASRQKPGCFEQAAKGTLFLDEVTEMSAKSQVDLLRVLEAGRYQRVGGEAVLETDVRILSATNKSVEALIEEGSFRDDLFYRLNVIPIEIPPLRQRREDIPLLVTFFIKHFCQRHQRPLKMVAPEALQVLVSARWPGNVRQLRNVVERLVVTHSGEVLHAGDLPQDLKPSQIVSDPLDSSQTLGEAIEVYERKVIAAALEENQFHREKTAKRLDVSIRTLHYKMSRYGLH